MLALQKIFLVFAFLLFSLTELFSQNSDLKKPLSPIESKFELHQFYLQDPAIKIMEMQYDKDCTPVKGKLSEDGKTVLIKEYIEHSRIYLKFLKADGKEEEVIKSPCFIDPVINVL